MIHVNDTIAIAEKDVEERFIRAMGPGGQNARNDQTAVQVRYDVARSALPLGMKLRLIALAGRQLNADGVLVINTRADRSQAKNRIAARRRLVALLQRAARVPAERRPTRPKRMDREGRLAAKKQHAAIKELRSRPREE